MVFVVMLVALVGAARLAGAQVEAAKVIFDTDIGDDIDDAYALGLLLRSPEVTVVGVTTAFGDTHLRARLVSRLLAAAGRGDVPVFEGVKSSEKIANSNFSQRKFAEGEADRSYPDAIGWMLETIRKNPGEITLVAVAPMTNVGALIAQDPETFRKLKRVVIMGGSVNRGYTPHVTPDPEWNIVRDVPAAKALFGAGVPLFVMPLDSTQIPLDAARRAQLFGKGTGLAKALEELTTEWQGGKAKSPVLFDSIAAGYTVKPSLCPVTPMRIEVDDKGYTRKVDGPANAQVCLNSDPGTFFRFFMPRMQ